MQKEQTVCFLHSRCFFLPKKQTENKLPITREVDSSFDEDTTAWKLGKYFACRFSKRDAVIHCICSVNLITAMTADVV